MAMRLAHSLSDGQWCCRICGTTGKATTQPDVDKEVFIHLRDFHDRILITPKYPRNHDGQTVTITAYYGKALTDYESRLERNQITPDPPQRRAGHWRKQKGS
jgi:hypothetical protein